MAQWPNRRQYLATLGTLGVAGVAGCSQSDPPSDSTQTEVQTSNPAGADFSFEYDGQAQQVTIQFNGGGTLRAGNLQVRSSTGMQTEWSQLGSTTTGSDQILSSGATAVIGPDILNWGQAVGPNDMIRLVFEAGSGPSTLGRFTPMSETPSDPPADSTAPSISAFSISNLSGQTLRISFDSNERLTQIRVDISADEDTTLETDDFNEIGTASSSYSYEATYVVSGGGQYSATLIQAGDENENDGAQGESASISLASDLSLEEKFSKLEPNNWDGAISIDESTGVINISHTGSYNGGPGRSPVGGVIAEEPIGEPPFELICDVEYSRNSIENDITFGLGGKSSGTRDSPMIRVNGNEVRTDDANLFAFHMKNSEGDKISEQTFTTSSEKRTYRISYDGSRATLYIDDTEVASVTGSIETPVYTTVGLEDDPHVETPDEITISNISEE